jgi:dephospho-CoA kinase
MTAFRVGLTGGLAAGKSTVAAWLRHAGFPVLDADAVVADLYAAGEPGAEIVSRLFGPELLDPHGQVDRQLLAQRIFSDADARHRLEVEIHPLVLEHFERFCNEHRGVVVLEATLLVESSFAEQCDLVVTVEAAAAVRLQRAVVRGLEESAARQRMEVQDDGRRRRAAAHRVLQNDGSRQDLRRQVEALIQELTEAGQ